MVTLPFDPEWSTQQTPYCHYTFRRQDDPEGASVLTYGTLFLVSSAQNSLTRGCLNIYSV
jgi:hypothetical protein